MSMATCWGDKQVLYLTQCDQNQSNARVDAYKSNAKADACDQDAKILVHAIAAVHRGKTDD